jgi:citrate synthase
MSEKQTSRSGQAPPDERRARPRESDTRWRTALTRIEPNKILVRGYPLDELMGRVSFGEAIYLLLVGELPTPAMGQIVEALLVSFIDHGATPPSTLAARNTATTGAPLRACVAAGVLGFGRYFGGDIAACMELLDAGLALVRQGRPMAEVADEVLAPFRERGETPPGFGHRYHSRDPRAARLFQMALELELEGEHVRFIRALELALERARRPEERPVPVNIDGAIAAVCSDIGLRPDVAEGLFIISRVPGIVAHALEEQARCRPMRQIDPTDFEYDGPAERRLPETRRR